MKIIDAIEPLWNNMFVKIQTSKIKTEKKSILQLEDVKKMACIHWFSCITIAHFIKYNVANNKVGTSLNILQVGESEAESMYQDEPKTALFLGYDTLEKLLLNYQKCVRMKLDFLPTWY